MMRSRISQKGARMARHALFGALALAMVAGGAQAQNFSKGYKFLESVRNNEMSDVNNTLSEPGNQIINTHDISTGDTALHILADGNANPDLPEMLRILARHGARPDQPNAKGFTPAGIAEQSLREVKAAFQAAFPPPAEPGPAPNPAAIPS